MCERDDTDIRSPSVLDHIPLEPTVWGRVAPSASGACSLSFSLSLAAHTTLRELPQNPKWAVAAFKENGGRSDWLDDGGFNHVGFDVHLLSPFPTLREWSTRCGPLVTPEVARAHNLSHYTLALMGHGNHPGLYIFLRHSLGGGVYRGTSLIKKHPPSGTVQWDCT